MMFVLKSLSGLLLFLFILNCGGGAGPSANLGGGGDGTDYTTEYNNTKTTLDMIGATTANNAGYTGVGVKVSVVDTGIETSHVEFNSGKTFTGNSYVTGKSQYDDVNGHGSHVAGIIAANRNGTGMRGVAYGIQHIMSQRILNDSGSTSMADSTHANVVNAQRTASVDFSNNSWGSGSIEIDEINSTWVTNNISSSASAYQNAVASDVVFVWAAGNNSRSQPSYQAGLPDVVNNIEAGWVAVMSVDNNKRETLYTQRCGDAAAWCVAAPGGGDTQSTQGIYSVKSSGGYTRLSGTSMAAPQVTGMLALIKDRFSSSLTNQQVRTRLLNGATYTGLVDYYGVSASNLSTAQKQAIFGKGMINYGNSVAQIGSLNYPTSNNFFKGNNQNIDESKIALPNNLHSNISDQVADLDIMAFDSFDGADFTVKGSKIFNTSNKKTVKAFGYSNEESKKTKLSFNYFNNKINYTLSNNINVLQENNWKSKNTFLNFFSETGGSYSNLEHQLNNLSLSYFVQYPNHDNKNNSYSIGFNYNKEIYEKKLNILFNYTDHRNLISDYSIIKDNKTLSDSEIIDYGFVYKFNNNADLFFRKNREYLKSENPSNYNFSIDSGYIDSEIIGIELNKNNSLFNFGFYKPNHFKNSELTFFTPTGRNAYGDIYWKETTLDINNEVYYSPYISLKNKVPSVLPQFRNNFVSINLRQSPYNSNLVDSGELLFTLKF